MSHNWYSVLYIYPYIYIYIKVLILFNGALVWCCSLCLSIQNSRLHSSIIQSDLTLTRVPPSSWSTPMWVFHAQYILSGRTGRTVMPNLGLWLHKGCQRPALAGAKPRPPARLVRSKNMFFFSTESWELLEVASLFCATVLCWSTIPGWFGPIEPGKQGRFTSWHVFKEKCLQLKSFQVRRSQNERKGTSLWSLDVSGSLLGQSFLWRQSDMQPHLQRFLAKY